MLFLLNRFKWGFVVITLYSSLGLANPLPSVQPYTQTAFEAAQKLNKTIIVHVHADWCAVCIKQKKIIAQLINQPHFKDVVVFELIYGRAYNEINKEILKNLKIEKQSTIIAFLGAIEKGRIQWSDGWKMSDPQAIESLIKQALPVWQSPCSGA